MLRSLTQENISWPNAVCNPEICLKKYNDVDIWIYY
jgi:hypothetical protein